MSSDFDEKIIALKRSLNTSAVQLKVDPPGLFEAKDPRKRKGIRRIPYRSGREPTLEKFIHHPAQVIEQARANGEKAEWWGATNMDKASHMFARRIHWESYAPRYANTGVGNLPYGMIDFWYEKGMYGKVDLGQNAIYISETYLTALNEGDASIMAPVFVARAYRDFQKEWDIFFRRNARATGTSRGGNSPLVFDGGKYKPQNARLPVQTGWTSVHPQYQANMDRIFEAFQQWTLTDGRREKILTFKDFMQYMLYFIDIITPTVQITRSGYIMSAGCNRAISGWQIDMWPTDPGNDILKKEEYLNDPNFEMFAAMAQKYGFMIDFNVPWRLVADVMSTPMRKYIRDWAVEGRVPWEGGKSVNITELIRLRDEHQSLAASYVDPSDDLDKIKADIVGGAIGKWRAATDKYNRAVEAGIIDGTCTPPPPFWSVHKGGEEAMVNSIFGRKNAGNHLTEQQRNWHNKRAQEYGALVRKYQTKNLDILFRTCYYRADSTDLQVLMNYFCSMWNSFAAAFPTQAVAQFRKEHTGTNSEVITIVHDRYGIKFDGSATPEAGFYATIKNNNHSMLAGKTINRADTQSHRFPSSYDVFVDTFGADFPARLYLFIRAREAAVDWTQKIFDKNVKNLAEIQKNLDGKRALDYINNKTNRLPAPGGNPPFRTADTKAKTFKRYESRERTNAGRGQFMLIV